VEDITSSLESLGFHVIDVKHMTATRSALNGRTHVELLAPVLVASKGNIKSQEVLKLKSFLTILSSR
jgi:hypothetical protein